MQAESEVRSPMQCLKWKKKINTNHMQSRPKDPPKQDTAAESRPDPDCILGFTENNHQLPSSPKYKLAL